MLEQIQNDQIYHHDVLDEFLVLNLQVHYVSVLHHQRIKMHYSNYHMLVQLVMHSPAYQSQLQNQQSPFEQIN
ncbi:hypothetical protein BLA27_25460 [Brucella cytisi]|uniref:Uncharacterized protein n=1 Tax=Brucella cytisi TaxID=407152 RepID=A0A1J6HVP4_9HYPH|nr:hypothetical protein BLA27_25460 [Brucella cytisi]